MPSNDNGFAMTTAPSADAHGRAALLLVESLVHGLCDSGTLTPREAVEIAERAVNVQRDHAESADDAGQMWQSHALLSAIATSLSADDIGGPPLDRLS